MSHDHARTPIHGPDERTIVRSMDAVPVFTSECEEADYWSTHELAADLFDDGPSTQMRKWRSPVPASGASHRTLVDEAVQE